MKYITTILIIGFLISCGKKIEITNEFIINEHWNDYNNAIGIEKMKVNDSSLNIFADDFQEEPNHWNIVNKLKIDSTLNCYYGGLNINFPDKPKLKGKVYFNKYNGWEWSINGEKKPTFGKLKNNTWYKFSNLTTSALYKYVYVDSIGATHIFTANLDNY